MDIQDDQIYRLKHLQEYLKGRRLPFSKPTIIKLEKAGFIPSPRLNVGVMNMKPPRAYTGKVIKEIAAKIEGGIS